MAEVKILHCADVHIGAVNDFLGLKAKQRRAETLITFQKTVELAKLEDVKLFLIAGDLFDSLNIEYSYIRDVLESISQANEIKFVYAAGNHDPYDINSPLRKTALPSNLFIFDTKDSFFTFEDIKARVYGRSFKEVYDSGTERFSIAPINDGYVNIMCIHGELSADKNSNYNPITPAFVKESGMDYIALGHVHKCTEIGRIADTDFAYCGCPEGQGFDETGKKGVLLGTVSNKSTDLRFYPVNMRSHITESVDITGTGTNAEISQLVKEKLENEYGENYGDNLYKIVLTGTFDGNPDTQELLARLGENLYFVKIKDETRPAVNLEILAKEPSLKGIFVKKMLEKIKNASEEEKPALNYALNLGLKSFLSEVNYIED